MSGVREFLSNLGPARSVFLACVVVGAGTAFIIGLTPGIYGTDNLVAGLAALATWLFLGLLFGGIAWTVNTLSLWRRSLIRRLAPQRDVAVEALRERYARGEIEQDEFESTLHRLRES